MKRKKFWKLSWSHFGGKNLRFMGGFKNMSQVLMDEGQLGLLIPKDSDIN